MEEVCVSCPDTLCGTGQYRNACGGSEPGHCIDCSNAPENAVYTSPGTPFDQNACMWECANNTEPPGNATEEVRGRASHYCRLEWLHAQQTNHG